MSLLMRRCILSKTGNLIAGIYEVPYQNIFRLHSVSWLAVFVLGSSMISQQLHDENQEYCKVTHQLISISNVEEALWIQHLLVLLQLQ